MRIRALLWYIALTIIYVSGTSASAEPRIHCLQSTEAPDEQPVITTINITGNEVLSDCEILDMVTVEAGDVYEPVRVQLDEATLEASGLFESVTVRRYCTDKGIGIEFVVVEKPAISGIRFEGNSAISDEELLRVITERQGDIFRTRKLQEDIQALVDYYHSQGYDLMEVVGVSTPLVNEDNTLTFTIREGIIEDVIVEGNTHTRDEVILRELKLREQAAFNREQLIEDGKRLYNLDYFSIIEPRVFPGTNPDTVIIAWYVEEKQTFTVNAGGSYASVLGFSLFVDLNLDNLTGRGDLLSFKGEWGQRITSYLVKYYNPWIGKVRTSLTTRLWNIDSQIYGDKEGRAVRTGADLALGRELSDYWDISAKTEVEHVNPRESDISDYDAFYVGGTVSYDTRDIWIDPTHGQFYSLTLEQSIPVLAARLSLLTYHINLENFFGISDNQVIATRLLWSEMYGKVPDTERFYLGGGTTIRGFPDVSPFARGSRRVLGSIEYRLRFNNWLQGVVFFDFGRIGAVDPDVVNLEGDRDWRSGSGIGARVYTPIGPVRLDYGFTDARGYIVNDEKGYQTLHFSFGQAF